MYGALPPSDRNWEIGKTAAQIIAIRKLEEYADDFATAPKEIDIAIEKIKNGTKKVNGTESLRDLLSD